jgi:hypothetical protein
MKVWIEPAKRGDSIKPGVERSGTPGDRWSIREKPLKGATAMHHEKIPSLALSHASRAWSSHVSLPWGSASLHPRLYASTHCAGFEKRISACASFTLTSDLFYYRDPGLRGGRAFLSEPGNAFLHHVQAECVLAGFLRGGDLKDHLGFFARLKVFSNTVVPFSL